MGQTADMAAPELAPREGTPVTDAVREILKDPEKGPQFAQDLAAIGNAAAAGLQAASTADPPAPAETSAFILIEDVAKVDLRVGTVLSAERVPKSTKMLKLSVDLGEAAPRQILGGIGETFQPEEIIGKQFGFVTNLSPRKMMGLESNGMILAVGEPASLSLMVPSGTVPPGSRLK